MECVTGSSPKAEGSEDEVVGWVTPQGVPMKCWNQHERSCLTPMLGHDAVAFSLYSFSASE